MASNNVHNDQWCCSWLVDYDHVDDLTMTNDDVHGRRQLWADWITIMILGMILTGKYWFCNLRNQMMILLPKKSNPDFDSQIFIL